MAGPKYQIFVSSTYEDLKEQRDQVIKGVLEMGHIPVGMEMFSAADEDQWEIIKRTIDDTDYYVVIVAHRYGSVVDGISFTEKEYDYAVSQGIPVLGFVIEDSASWPGDQRENGPAKMQALEAFKAKVKNKPVDFWSNKDELYAKSIIALGKQITRTPRMGWVRADQATDPQVASELARLSAENERLRRENDLHLIAERLKQEGSLERFREYALEVKKGGFPTEIESQEDLYLTLDLIERKKADSAFLETETKLTERGKSLMVLITASLADQI